jgi:hypothetical protein
MKIKSGKFGKIPDGFSAELSRVVSALLQTDVRKGGGDYSQINSHLKGRQLKTF